MPEKESRNRTSANGEGGCRYIESKKLWCCRITIGWESTENGQKQMRKAFYGKTKKEALQKATAAQARLINGQAAVSSNMKLSDWANKWLLDYKSGLSPRTVDNYTEIVKNQIKPAIGEKTFKNLKKSDIQRMLTDLVIKGSSKSLVSRVKMLTNAMLEAAVDDDLLIKNPCRKVKFPSMSESIEKEPFTPEEEKIIYEYASKYLTKTLPHVPHRIGNIIIILLKTGMRQEELLALQWKHIDFKRGVIHIRQAVTIKDGHPKLKDPKTFKSNRDIPMHSDVVGILSKSMPTEDDINEQYIFGNEKRELWLPRNFQRDYKKFFVSAIADGYNIKYRSPHICRHTFASDLRAAGVDIKTISVLLGHSRVDITVNVYDHTDEKSMLDAISRL